MKQWPAAMHFLVLGFYVAFSLLIPALIGFFWLGPKFGHTILFFLIGLGLGTIIMIYGVYRMVKPFMEEAKKEGQEEQLHGPAKMLSSLVSSKQKEDEEQE